MNTSWYEKYLSDEWSGWGISAVKKYDLTEEEIFFGWWLTGDVQASHKKLNEIFQLINKAKKDEDGEFNGRSFDTIFTHDKIYILRSSTKEQHQYPLEQIEEALLEWEFSINQLKEK